MKKNAVEILKTLENKYTDCKFTLEDSCGSRDIYAEKNDKKAMIGKYKDNAKIYIESFLNAVESYKNKDSDYKYVKQGVDDMNNVLYERFSKKQFILGFILDDILSEESEE